MSSESLRLRLEFYDPVRIIVHPVRFERVKALFEDFMARWKQDAEKVGRPSRLGPIEVSENGFLPEKMGFMVGRNGRSVILDFRTESERAADWATVEREHSVAEGLLYGSRH